MTRLDVLWIYGGGAVALGLLFVLWRPLIMVTIHEELAQVEGVPIHLVRFVLMLLFALVVSVAMKVVGIVLLVSLLIIPAAAARRLSASPAGMAVAAGAVGCLAVAAGLGASLQWDVPTGAAIVAAAALIFFAVVGVPARRGA
jgi:zinc transport system permease protein